MSVRTLLIRTAGTNCDRELAFAFEQAGSATELVHVDALVREPDRLLLADIIALPGGFSYGDDIAAGRIFANRMKSHLLESFRQAISNGTLIIGICNGFQVLVKMGLLPAITPETLGEQSCTLAHNHSGRFIDRWVKLRVPNDTCCVWTQGLTDLELPIAHGEGRFVTRDGGILAKLDEQGQIALQYHPNDNPNGSVADIAGICDPTGQVFGLMPHPERYIVRTQHPAWTRLPENDTATAGAKIIQNAVDHQAVRNQAAV